MLLTVGEQGSTWVKFNIPEHLLETHRPVVNSSIQEGWNGARMVIVEVEMQENPVVSHNNRLNVFEQGDADGY